MGQPINNYILITAAIVIVGSGVFILLQNKNTITNSVGSNNSAINQEDTPSIQTTASTSSSSSPITTNSTTTNQVLNSTIDEIVKEAAIVPAEPEDTDASLNTQENTILNSANTNSKIDSNL